MNIRLLLMGKTDLNYVKEGMDEYTKRLNHYVNFTIYEIPVIKNTPAGGVAEQLVREAEAIMKHVSPGDITVLLDEHGTHYSSNEFATFLNQRFRSGGKNLVFIVGGAFGFGEELKKRAGFFLSLSRMTFPHQLVRVIFTEQLYRALTILRNESYHHE